MKNLFDFKKISASFSKPRLPARTSVIKTILLGQEQISYHFTVSRLARRITIKITPEKGLEVVVPYRHNPLRLEHFIREKQAWILRHLHKMEHHKEKSFQLVDGAKLQILGVDKTIHLRPSTKKKSYVKEIQPLIFAHGVATQDTPQIHIFSNGNATQAKKVLENHLKKIAEKYFFTRTSELSKQMGITYGTITIRSQKTRWGSCSSHNNLNFNWRLILMPLQIADYVIYHELTHTVHHNHSARFYALLQKFCPNYKELRKVLTQNKEIF